MGYDVFISHSTNDKGVADAVCAALEANGVRCWIAPRDIIAGESWANAIVRGIAECRAMVLVFSAAANVSPHVRREVERAVFRNIPVAPVRVEDVMPSGDMEYFLAGSHWMDALTLPFAGHLPSLTSQVRALLRAAGRPAAPTTGGPPPAAPPAAPGPPEPQPAPPVDEANEPSPEPAGDKPAFGRYQAERRIPTRAGVCSAWVARAEGSDRRFLVKVYRPSPDVQTAEEISAGVRAFLDRARAQKRAAALPGSHVAPVHETGQFPGGAWFVTDHYPWSARKLIDGKVKAGEAALYSIAEAAVEAIAALKQSRGQGHGNVTPANVLLDGPPGAGPSRAFLADPLGPDRLGVNGAGEEANDLFALGQILYELVTGRRWKPAGWPIAPSPAWAGLGRRGDGWRELCNRLLHPDPADGLGSLDDARAQLASLSPRSPPGTARGIRRIAIAACFAAALAVPAALALRAGVFTRPHGTGTVARYAAPGDVPPPALVAAHSGSALGPRPSPQPTPPAAAPRPAAATLPATAPLPAAPAPRPDPQAELLAWAAARVKPAVTSRTLLDAWETDRRKWVAGLTYPDGRVEKDLNDLGASLEALERSLTGQPLPPGLPPAKAAAEREKVFAEAAAALTADGYRPDPLAPAWRQGADEYAGWLRHEADGIHVAALLESARRQVNQGSPADARRTLDEIAKLDKDNAEALALRKKIAAYYDREFVNTQGIKFVRIPAGEFDMGTPAAEAGRYDDETLHHVKITRSFLMGTTHVTVGQFAAFVKDDGYRTDAEKEGFAYAWTGTKFDKVDGAHWGKPGFTQGADEPVVEVSWNDAVAFCAWLNKKEPGHHYRLPTEAEWEYVCRAGTQTAYPWGNDPDDGKGWANCADLTAKEKFPTWTTFNWSDGFVFTSPAGKFRPNAFGLYDMIGNAWEWCSDWYDEYPKGEVTNPTGPTEPIPNKAWRVLRGGSWDINPRDCRCGYRSSGAPDDRDGGIGFRLALDF